MKLLKMNGTFSDRIDINRYLRVAPSPPSPELIEQVINKLSGKRWGQPHLQNVENGTQPITFYAQKRTCLTYATMVITIIGDRYVAKSVSNPHNNNLTWTYYEIK